EVHQQQLSNQPFVFSMASVKRRALNDHLLDTFISRLELSPTEIKSHPNYQNLRSYGMIAA
ncbi:MAG: IS4 family transposase, partial [Phormidesmis sp. CAN_BIN36]|nr:IS4 family transposase [Phormidesmis sp. CAN_BIN36]